MNLALSHGLGAIRRQATALMLVVLGVPGLLTAQTIQHRYSFTRDASDSVGGTNWNGTLVGNAYITNNSLVLPGGGDSDNPSGYVQLPNGIVSNDASITVECWLTDNAGLVWAEAWCFGNSGSGPGQPPSDGTSYISLIPHSGANAFGGDDYRAAFNLTGNDELDVVEQAGNTMPTGVKEYSVVTYDAASATATLYLNGALVGSASIPTNLAPANYGTTFNNWIGRDEFGGDPMFAGVIDELRIWNGAVSPLYVTVSTLAGPNIVVTNLTPVAVNVAVTNTTMIAGQTQQATVTATFLQVTNVPVTGDVTSWSSSNPGILAVNSNGLITAVSGGASGSATISALVGGAIGTSASIAVSLSPPSIVQQPVSLNRYVGQTAVFSVVAVGGQLTYQWSVGSEPIAGATGSSFTLTDLSVTNSGKYSVLVSNSVGTTNSAAATLNVSASALVHRWSFNTDDNDSIGGANGTNMNGAYLDGNGNVVIPGSGFLSTDNNAPFVAFPPGIMTNLNSITVEVWTTDFAGQTWAEVWCFGGGTSGMTQPAIDCCTNYLSFIPTSGSDDMRAAFKVLNEQDVIYPNTPMPLNAEEYVVLTYDAPSTTATLYLNGVQVGINTNITITPASMGNTFDNWLGRDQYGDPVFDGSVDELRIWAAPVSPLYQALTFAAGPDTLITNTTPSLVTVSVSDTVMVGGQTQQGTVTGTFPQLTNTLTLANYAVWTTSDTNVLTVNSAGVITAGSGGTATVRATVGGVTGTSASINVTAAPPVIAMQPSPASATDYVGGLVTFTAQVVGSPPIALQWEHDGAAIPNATASTLTLAGLQTNEAGTYTLVASSPLGVTNSLPAVLTVLPPPNSSGLNVLTYHNDNSRLGAYTNEVLLTLANVNVSTFGRIITYPTDGLIIAQPLYVAGLAIPGHGTHNAVFVATENDSVYAFDADGVGGTNGGLLWHTNLGTAVSSYNDEFGNRYQGTYYGDIVPVVGITGTPVIDLASGTLYVNVHTREVGATTNYYHRIHALNITNGAERAYSPMAVTNSVPGKGVESTNGVVGFNPRTENQRPGLTLAGGMLYVAYGSYADTDPYHGWVLGFNATNLQQSASYVFNTTPNASIANFGVNAGEGALWMSGNGLCVDAATNLYFATANGSFSANTNGGDYGDSFIKLTTINGLAVADYFTPYNQAGLAADDLDLGSGGTILLPDSVGSAAHPHLMVGCGKDGMLRLVDRDNMGHYNAINDNQIVQEVPGAISGAWSTPAYFNNQIYYQGSGDVMKAFYISNALITPTPVSESTVEFSAFATGGTPSISANGTNNAIVWAIQSDASGSSGPDVLHAFNATNLAQELYNSSQNLARDNPGAAIIMTTPTVANGKVFVGAQYALSIFGNSLFLATPVISPDGGLFVNNVTVTLSDASPNTTIYYTLDGTAPTTNSIPYTGPFVLTSSASVHAIAAEFGAVNSGEASAGFIDSSAGGSGTGLTGNYWANTSSAAFTNINFTELPTLTRTDAVINFNWSSAGPSPLIGQTNFAVRWTGSVQPEYNETYTFTTLADDGAQLWVNGQLLISDWTSTGATQSNSASITLKAQEIYNVAMNYFQASGNAVAQLLWSSPSTPQGIIPQSQLYPYTNPPPTVVLSSPITGSTYTAAASVSITATADALYNPLAFVSFYTNGSLAGTVSNAPYSITVTGLPAGSYTLTATATDGSGLTGTSAPVAITVAASTGVPYGLTALQPAPAFYNMPATYTSGPIPALLSQTGVFSNTPAMIPTNGLIPYIPNTPLWSDSALKIRYMSIPNSGGLETPEQQIAFAPTGGWTFPSGTVFVKTFELQTNLSDPNSIHRLETRLIVRDTNGVVYGVTYKWLPDNSDAVLLSNSLTEAIQITNTAAATGFTQQWYYPSPADCLTCHTLVGSYVLGVNTRQLNGPETYPATGVTDNQLRALNRLGLFNPAFDEAGITNFEQLSSVTNQNASLVQRARSYLDANCAQCHQPGGTGITFNASYDTPLTNQNIINAVAAFSLGYDNAKVVAPSDIWRSVLYDRMNTVNPTIKMPPLDRNTIDTNAVELMAQWINSLGGTPALAPPVLSPASGTFTNEVTLTLLPPDANASIYYTLDGSAPTTNSILYSGPFELSLSAVVTANAFETNYVNSVTVSGVFTIVPPLYSFMTPSVLADGTFQMEYWAPAGQTYILETSTDLINWTPLSTNLPTATPFTLTDPGAGNAPYRYYRVVTQ